MRLQGGTDVSSVLVKGDPLKVLKVVSQSLSVLFFDGDGYPLLGGGSASTSPRPPASAQTLYWHMS